MSVVRAYFHNIGKQLIGDFTTRQMKQGWARTKNRTSLNNFGYCGPPPSSSPDHHHHHHSNGDNSSNNSSNNSDTCWYKMDCPASMQTLDYEVVVECKCSGGRITQVMAGVCSGDCPAGLSGQCVHVAALLIAAVNVLRPLQTDFAAPSTSGLCLWNQHGAGSICTTSCVQFAIFLLPRRISTTLTRKKTARAWCQVSVAAISIRALHT